MRSASLLAILCGVGLTLPLAAQMVEVSGQVVDDVTGHPIPGARINLEFASVLLASAVTDATGRFVVRGDGVPATLTVAAMGMVTADTTLQEAGSLSLGMIRLAAEPVELEGIEASAAAACEATPTSLRAGAESLAEARSALQAISENDRRRGAEYVMELVRMVAPDGPGEGWQRDTTRARLPSSLMGSPPAELQDNGFAVATDDSTNVYRPPTAEWLASTEFPESYCIAAAIGEAGERVVRFWPKDPDQVVGVDGVLRLSEEGQPTAIEFTYTSLLRFLEIHALPALIREFQLREGTMVVPVKGIQISPDDHGGRVVFTQVSDGHWMTTSWEVRGARLSRRALWEMSELKGVWPKAEPWIAAGRLLAVIPSRN